MQACTSALSHLQYLFVKICLCWSALTLDWILNCIFLQDLETFVGVDAVQEWKKLLVSFL
jgi:hypothetical protein